MMLMLGEYRFRLDTAAYQSKTRSTSYCWGKQARLTTEPAWQYIGPGDDSLSIQGVIFPHDKGGLGQMDSLRQEAEKGESLLLLEGSGKVLGRWVIESISENQSIFFKDGTPRRIGFTLQLRKDENAKNTRVNDLAMVTQGSVKERLI
ncbi:phage tail protein [Candidatus Williamhamiltonella defendens]|uniref:Phage tail protein n=1 Tax=Candidatus Hamiltonella defensa (Bemisia tabaci) TaxID=672795 RepID=A0A0E4G276_9ENTR|nr:phage tail protein [Candidatus Hamiltonella defensa]ASX25860.1 phage tail protein [Candidatus Hamiltonella defensa (Bemisia tabaci)]ASX25924.1 phage tail protein [Candidatus Hamiltonella defensa (Bemisia tabaci)]CED78165.1 Phage protein gpU [Candidatus Hamiltonella defensa (Bemisia tabaci)]CED79085.1 Phage protein gpU [Candidatus Hamiltonella defensa (Bemisia tabaci)]